MIKLEEGWPDLSLMFFCLFHFLRKKSSHRKWPSRDLIMNICKWLVLLFRAAFLGDLWSQICKFVQCGGDIVYITQWSRNVQKLNFVVTLPNNKQHILCSTIRLSHDQLNDLHFLKKPFRKCKSYNCWSVVQRSVIWLVSCLMISKSVSQLTSQSVCLSVCLSACLLHTQAHVHYTLTHTHTHTHHSLWCCFPKHIQQWEINETKRNFPINESAIFTSRWSWLIAKMEKRLISISWPRRNYKFVGTVSKKLPLFEEEIGLAAHGMHAPAGRSLLAFQSCLLGFWAEITEIYLLREDSGSLSVFSIPRGYLHWCQ